MQFEMKNYVQDLGTKQEVMDALPYAVVGGAFDGSLSTVGIALGANLELLNHVVPAGKQLKILFLRVATTDAAGAIFSIVQTNPTALGQTGVVEAYPVVGSVPSGARDYPMLEAAGAEVLRGSLKDPVYVLEGTVSFQLQGYQPVAGANTYILSWSGVEDSAIAHGV
jgi:hypothetical protein